MITERVVTGRPADKVICSDRRVEDSEISSVFQGTYYYLYYLILFAIKNILDHQRNISNIFNYIIW